MTNDTAQAVAPLEHTILIVDDDARVRRALISLLRWAGGWRIVGEVADAHNALAQARLLRPEVVLLDVWLAHHSGLGLITQLRQLTPAPRVFVLTVDNDTATQQQALAQGASGFILKTTLPLDLLVLLQGMFDD